MRLSFGLLVLVGCLLFVGLITGTESVGKSRNREDRFDLETESGASDEISDSCESAEALDNYSCRNNKPFKRKTFRFAI
ncbi:hypothetical protein KR018_012530 [Drosophila ironensis]|nr:hypothetical protein KR018_012530 [Drosophila ironensis]